MAEPQAPVTPTPAPAEGIGTSPSSAKAAALAKWAEIDGPEEAPVAAAAEPVAAEPSKPPESTKEPEKRPETAEMAALVRKDKYQREIHARRLAELKAKETEIAEKASRAAALDTFAADFARDPAGTLKKLGVSKLADAAKALWLDEVGDAAPKEYKDEAWKRKVEHEIAERDRQIEALRQERILEKQQAETQRMISDYQGGLKSVFSSVGDDKPHVKALMGHDSEGLIQEAWNHVVAFAEANPEQELPEPAQVLEYVERILETRTKPFRAMLGPKVEQTGQKAESKGAAPTLSDSTSAPSRANPSGRTVEEVKAKLKGDLDSLPWE